jgi:hypothetical protein
MATLAEVFTQVSPSIVAIIASGAVVPAGVAPPIFPQIIGTGFFADADGTVVTNRHVIDAVMKYAPKHPKTGNVMAAVLAFGAPQTRDSGVMMPIATVEIEWYIPLEGFETKNWFGKQIPDLGILLTNVTETPGLSLGEDDFQIQAGVEIATCGFPMGSEIVVRDGRLQQLTPTLRRGIVSAVYPFPIAQPHGFSIDVMQQGGGSGSPVFKTDTGLAIGILHSGLPNGNHTFADPSWVIAKWLKEVKQNRNPRRNKARTLESLMRPPQYGESTINWLTL